MPVLIDSCVWARHIRSPNGALIEALGSGIVYTHDFVVGELILGSIKRGSPFLQTLESLRRLPTLPHAEVVAFARMHRLEGSGIGWIDAHLIASAAQAGEPLWTFDASLADACKKAAVPVRDD